MNVEGIPIKELWSFLTWLPKFLLQRKFTPETLARLIHVDLRPRGDSTTINLGDSASFELWIQVINLSPFEVELDRAEFRLWCGPILSAPILRRQKIAPGEVASLHVRGSITDGQANEIGKTIRINPVALEGHIDFNCKLHPFAKNIGHLESIIPRVLNADARC